MKFYPRLVVSDAAAAIEFYAAAFGARELERHTDDAGKIVHAMISIEGTSIAVKDEDEYDPAPTSLGGSPVILALEVDDVDALGATMQRAGATVVYPIRDWQHGQRGGRLADPYGHLWMLAQPR